MITQEAILKEIEKATCETCGQYRRHDLDCTEGVGDD